MRDNSRRSERLWSIILAGGEGERMRPFIHRWLGQPLPKQYCTFIGTRSMLEHTLDRADMLGRPEHKVTVIAQGHRKEAWRQLGDQVAGTVIPQPANRNTAAGVFLPLTFIHARDPEATVVLLPSDHFVFPEERFVQTVRRAVWAAEWMADRVVLIGVEPDRVEPEYGWIQVGGEVGWASGQQVSTVHGFLEKPSLEQAKAAFASGALWNTLVLAAKVQTLWRLGWLCVPEVMALFEELRRAIGSGEESAILHKIYRQMPARNFSSDVLGQAPDQLLAIRMSGVLWSDWGRPERILESLNQICQDPLFPSELVHASQDAESLGSRRVGDESSARVRATA